MTQGLVDRGCDEDGAGIGVLAPTTATTRSPIGENGLQFAPSAEPCTWNRFPVGPTARMSYPLTSEKIPLAAAIGEDPLNSSKPPEGLLRYRPGVDPGPMEPAAYKALSASPRANSERITDCAGTSRSSTVGVPSSPFHARIFSPSNQYK